MHSITMGIKDVAARLREAGMRASERSVSDGIVSGAYPFGRVVRVNPSGRHTFQIFRVDFEAWLKTKQVWAPDQEAK